MTKEIFSSKTEIFCSVYSVYNFHENNIQMFLRCHARYVQKLHLKENDSKIYGTRIQLLGEYNLKNHKFFLIEFSKKKITSIKS